MKKIQENKYLIFVSSVISLLFLIVPLMGNQMVFTLANQIQQTQTVIIDAGHGGIDGGAVSCTGVYESQINLQIALRLDDLMHLLGIRTIMIRDTDKSVYTKGETIAEKKISDIKERERIANTTPCAIYLSIHQNYFSDSKYSGSQVFYNSYPSSKDLAIHLQDQLRTYTDPANRRKCKRSAGVYLMEHINCTGVLIECGFLSNAREEAKLRSAQYQKQLCCVIAAATSQFLNT